MIRIGITGGIGSGKTVVCNIWESLGAYIINADRLAKDIMQTSKDVKKELVTHFGAAVYEEDGSLNRSYLADQAFAKDRVEELNAIVHPHVRAEANRLMDQAMQKGYAMGVLEAALLLPRPAHYAFEQLVLVLADEKERAARVSRRDRMPLGQVAERISHQKNYGKLQHLADIVIQNNGSLEELEQQSKKVYHLLLKGQNH